MTYAIHVTGLYSSCVSPHGGNNIAGRGCGWETSQEQTPQGNKSKGVMHEE